MWKTLVIKISFTLLSKFCVVQNSKAKTNSNFEFSLLYVTIAHNLSICVLSKIIKFVL